MGNRRRADKAPEPTVRPIAKMTDEEIMAKIQAGAAERSANRQAKTLTIQELFGNMCALVASATGKTFRSGIPTVSEQTAVKVLELSLSWALNSRNGAVNPLLDEAGEGLGETEIGSTELPTADETIEAVADPTDQE